MKILSQIIKAFKNMKNTMLYKTILRKTLTELPFCLGKVNPVLKKPRMEDSGTDL